MKKLLLIICLLVPGALIAQKKKALPKTYDLLIGTYTEPGKSKGIYVYRFYTETGKLAYLNEIDDVKNPSYLCVSDNHKFVYAVNEVGKNGEVSAFKFEPNTGKLELINKQPTSGADPCYVSIDKEQKNIFVANYSSGSLSVLPVNKDGSLNAPSEVLQDEGSGPNKDRQAGPHVHTAYLSPDEKYLLYTDLGTDKLNIYRYHASATKPLVSATPAFTDVTPGFGPRHLDFSHDKKFVYLLSEMGSAVNVYSYDNGKLKQKQSVTILKDGFSGQTGAAAIHISPDGKFLYTSNRLETNEIVVYAINQESGELTFVQRQPTFGKNPRDFAIEPNGNFLVVGNQGSDTVYVFRIDRNTGKLSQTYVRLDIGNPVCFKFTSAE
jgi:6-phosphogluconolactonase